MLVFVVPLQSPQASKDWSLVSRLTARTLRSLCAQTCPDFRVILVCNERPIDCPQHPNLTIIEEPFPVPTEHSQRMVNKFLKVHRGLVEARSLAPAHIMITDADDCVSRRLAAFVARHPEASGWHLDRGYVHDEASHWAFGRRRFDDFCGTSAIVRASKDELPSSMQESAQQFTLLAFGHGVIRDELARLGRPLSPLPFPGAVYMTASGENHTGVVYANMRSRRLLLHKILNAHYLTPSFRREFGLYPLPKA